MEVIDSTLKLAEEVIDHLIHFTTSHEIIDEELIIKSIGKTPTYVKKSINFLIQVGVVVKNDNNIKLNDKLITQINQNKVSPNSILKKSLTEYKIFTEYCQLLKSGKKLKTVLRMLIAKYDITNTEIQLNGIFDKWLHYLEHQPSQNVNEDIKKVTKVPDNNTYFWINDNGHLIYDQEAHTKDIVTQLESQRYKNPLFIDQARIDALSGIKKSKYDLRKLCIICSEINDAYRIGNYFTVGTLTRAVLDHISPIFDKKSFAEVANNYGSKSFKDAMQNLENFTRKISDSFLHSHIKTKENLPNSTTVDCRSAFDMLLGEIINILEE